jgi:tripartite ATP-independent transporter DctM subunit
MSLLAFSVFMLTGLIGIPLAHALIVGSLVALERYDVGSTSIVLEQMVTQATSFPLLAIPFFILTGSVMLHGALGQHLLGMLTSLLGRVHGGPGQVSVLSSTLFGGLSGSAVADAAALGPLLIPWQKRLGYPAAFSAATLASAATIDILIPPSIPFILYALTANASIAALFVAGVLPGLLLCVGFMAVCYVSGRMRGFPRDAKPFVWTVFLRQLLFALPAIILPVFILVVLRFGIATPTEVSVLAAFIALIFSWLIYRDLTWKRLLASVTEAGVATGVVLLLIMASSVLGWLFTYEQLPEKVVAWMHAYVTTPGLIILCMNLLMLALGMVLDLSAAILLLAPILLPLAISIGMDPVRLGVMMVVNLAIGLYTPPVGTTLFITSSVASVRIGQVVRELVPFYAVALAVLALVSYMPAATITRFF